MIGKHRITDICADKSSREGQCGQFEAATAIDAYGQYHEYVIVMKNI